ncbi:MAG: glutaredoxin family protein [Proteobacteria bacterium]|nr:glutaredoxin family protein [Pseudomonadota bacterium]
MPSATPVAVALGVALALASGASLAQYKVIGPDGKVTYTDRPPATTDSKVTALNGRGGAAAAEAVMPLELRQAVTRYPVTLYASTGACEPCDAGRAMLRQRGIPFAEKQVQSAEDGDALERVSGGRDAPTLAIGSQMLRGYSPEVWASYLDAAGYPRESRLPVGYQYPAPAPIVERRDANVARAAPAASAPEAPAAPPPASPTGIKF